MIFTAVSSNLATWSRSRSHSTVPNTIRVGPNHNSSSKFTTIILVVALFNKLITTIALAPSSSLLIWAPVVTFVLLALERFFAWPQVMVLDFGGVINLT